MLRFAAALAAFAYHVGVAMLARSLMHPFCLGRTLVGLVVTIAMCLVPYAAIAGDRAAGAPETPGASDLARGVELLEATPPNVEEALAAFRRSAQVRPTYEAQWGIARSYRALGRRAEAILTISGMLARYGETIPAAVRVEAHAAAREMRPHTGTIELEIRLDPTAAVSSPGDLSVTIDGRVIGPSERGRPILVDAGLRTVVARAPGIPDLSTRVDVPAGAARMPVILNAVPVRVVGQLSVQSNVGGATAVVDGVEMGETPWRGALHAGKHRVLVKADGFVSEARDVEIAPTRLTRVTMTLRPDIGERGEKGEAAAASPRGRSLWYGIAGAGAFGGSRTLSPALDENPSRSRALPGLLVFGKVGRRVTPIFLVELFGELGVSQTGSYGAPRWPQDAAQVSVAHLAVGPMVRFQSKGDFRVIGGTGAGLLYEFVSADLPQDAVTLKQVRGSGFAGTWLSELGVAWETGKSIVLEAGAFVNLYGVGGPKDELSGDRLFLSSPGFRAGGRAGLGFDL